MMPRGGANGSPLGFVLVGKERKKLLDADGEDETAVEQLAVHIAEAVRHHRALATLVRALIPDREVQPVAHRGRVRLDPADAVEAERNRRVRDLVVIFRIKLLRHE